MVLNIDLQDLYAFTALCEYGSFRHAADSVCISQSALSRRIEKLESALGVRLFNRTTRSVRLTQAGRTFAPRVRLLLNDMEDAVNGVSDKLFSDSGIVTVACIPSAARYFMPGVIARFRRRFSAARIRLVDTSAGNVYSSVHNREADFGLSFISSGESDLNFIPLVDETYQLICRQEHPFAQRPFLGWKEFFNSDYIWLNKSSGNRHLLDQALGGITLRRTPVCETQHVTTMTGMVEAGLGIAAVPSMIFPGTHPALVKINLVEPVVKRQVGLIRKTGSDLSPLANELEKIITGLFLP
ncbi:TPA: LysR family transcriptional regulator [Salmonella enterica]|nr:LysR family transcriptional regulator [Salmonella enterica subsp. diarizonae]EDE6508668.1 LysR family transcriptional regulator [Salmonella enterica subsp. enterica serovar Enteritidis]EJA0166484.1 LysR family transcriptional regulator [Salmonella enterica subsp. enterica serovar Sandiego]EJQ5249099.1 LysR family transcriptional regulator [Salmonella enterica]EDF0770571.1 LysR family transcriptional regulator [Salmonella enterica subsp. enterica serovar Enteritidis]